MGIILAIILFSVIVIVHEFGHFIVAKLNGIEVFEFSLGMGPTLFSREYKGTKYCLKLLPLGGSCMMGEDEIDEDSRVGNFNEKSVWARMSVIVAGPVFNFMLAFIFSVILVLVVGYDAPVIADVAEGYPAVEAGLEPGDTILKLNNKKINIWREIPVYNQFHPGEEMLVTYERDGEIGETILTPKYNEETNGYQLGIVSGGYIKANFFSALKYGVYEVKYWIFTVVESLKMLVTGGVSMDDIAGPVGIVNMVGDTYQESAQYGVSIVLINLMNIAILLSANLGVMNLLPIPALDGGRLVFLAIEAVRKKRIPPEKEGMFHLIGFALLMVLMVFIMFNDIRKIFM